MSAYRFSCPTCGQHIECDTAQAGTPMQCPGCHKDLVIPTPPQPSPVTPAPRPVRVQLPHPQPSSTPHVPLPPPRPAGPPPTAGSAPTEAGAAKKRRRLVVAGAAGVLGIVLVAGLFLVSRWQGTFNQARDKDDGSGALGGQVSHIADLQNTLEATDPAKMSGRLETAPSSADGPSGNGPGAAPPATVSSGTNSLDGLPLAKALWLPEPPESIPDGRANGLLGGSNFVVQTTLLLLSRSAPILCLRQGTGRVVDRDVLVYLPSQASSTLEGRSWTVLTTDQVAPVRVVVRWKNPGRGGLQHRSYPNGFALKLEFGKREKDILPGRLYLALPDPLESVVAGHFQATVRVPMTPPPASAPSTGSNAARAGG